MPSRRTSLRYLGLSGLVLAGALPPASGVAASTRTRARVIVVGGGFAGASCAGELKAIDPGLAVTLIEPRTTYTACPLSNLVLASTRSIEAQQFGYQGLRARGVTVRHTQARAVDALARTATLADGERLEYDRLVLAPGIEIRWGLLPGYDRAAAERMPHAWQAGAQTLLLRDQLRAMPDGGLVVMAVPDNPYRCPPGPYERASLIGHYLQQHKPAAKLLVLDAKDRFSKQPLFEQSWRALYGERIEWQGRADGAQVVAVDPSTRTLETDFDVVRADVANVIPPQRAGDIARVAGVTDASGWCPVMPLTFESTLAPGVHVIGDAAIANAMPKSAFAANAQARYCAVQISRALRGEDPVPAKLLNTCYSMAAPEHAFSIAGVYQPGAASWQEVPGAGGSSPLDATAGMRRREAVYARDWFRTLTDAVFGA